MGNGGTVRAETDGRQEAGRDSRDRARDAWIQRRNIAFTLVCWLILVVAALWVVAHVIHALLTLLFACLLAYALSPLVARLRRWMPRALALVIVYLALFALVVTFGYFVVTTAVAQLILLVAQLRLLLTPTANGGQAPLIIDLQRLGISQAQIQAALGQLFAAVQAWSSELVPVVGGIARGLLDTVLVIVISVYVLVDGMRVATWASTRTPLLVRGRIQSFLATSQRVVGGYIRGQVLLCGLIGFLVGLGMLLFHVPYAVLLGVMAFVLEFIPIIGTLVSGAICVLIALTQGWFIALLVLAYFIGVHVLEGDVIGPRIVGHAIGLHPVVSIVALVAAADLFGVWGALLAAPLAGLAQAILIDAWAEWRKQHPEQFHQAVTSESPGAATAASAASALAGEALDGGAPTNGGAPTDGDDAQPGSGVAPEREQSH